MADWLRLRRRPGDAHLDHSHEAGAILLEHSPLVYVKKQKGKGRGVFAKRAIKKGELIEKVPVVIVARKEFVGGDANRFMHGYLYEWEEDTMAICLGYGLLYNHSYTPNARYKHGANTMSYIAHKNIAKDEEITINYNWIPDDQTDVGFEVR